jgi:biopolymer transport protein ExbD
MKLRVALVACSLAFSACHRRHREIVHLPEGADHARLERNPSSEVIINIDRRGRREVDAVVYDLNGELKRYLLKRRTGAPETYISIRADRWADFETVLKVMELAKEAGFSGVLIATKGPGANALEALRPIHF